MAKTTNTQKTPNTAAQPAANQSGSALPIIAAALFLLAEVCRALISMSQSETGWRPGVGTFLILFLVVSLFLRRDRDLVPAALALTTLNMAVSLLQSVARGGGIGVILNYYNFTSLALEVLTLLLALPNLRDKMRKVWWLPGLLGAVILTVGTFMEQFGHTFANPFLFRLCVQVYAYFFLCAWLAYPDMTFRGMIASAQEEPDDASAGQILGYMFVKELPMGIGCGAVLLVIMGVVSLFEHGNLSVLTDNSFAFPIFLFLFPAMWSIYKIFLAMREGAKQAKRMKHDMNVIKSSMGGAIGAQAKAELRKEAGKKAANAVIKGALVGDLIGGDTGAVVGAMAAKAKLDQATGTPGVDGAAKDAVTGGLITGSSSAVVGGLADQARKDAENSIK